MRKIKNFKNLKKNVFYKFKIVYMIADKIFYDKYHKKIIKLLIKDLK